MFWEAWRGYVVGVLGACCGRLDGLFCGRSGGPAWRHVVRGLEGLCCGSPEGMFWEALRSFVVGGMGACCGEAWWGHVVGGLVGPCCGRPGGAMLWEACSWRGNVLLAWRAMWSHRT